MKKYIEKIGKIEKPLAKVGAIALRATFALLLCAVIAALYVVLTYPSSYLAAQLATASSWEELGEGVDFVVGLLLLVGVTSTVGTVAYCTATIASVSSNIVGLTARATVILLAVTVTLLGLGGLQHILESILRISPGSGPAHALTIALTVAMAVIVYRYRLLRRLFATGKRLDTQIRINKEEE